MTSLLQLDNLQDCISGANSEQITKLFPKCRPRDINLNPLQQQTAQQDGQHDHDNNSLLRHRLSVVSVVMDALPTADRCMCVFIYFGTREVPCWWYCEWLQVHSGIYERRWCDVKNNKKHSPPVQLWTHNLCCLVLN